ncbi:hypothetical protein HGRIS_003148 [Hohenbuehelia grisea]|uniref:Cytochrome P450 n=1 Tax=Hohenbuehelia grisea TaxID=104357 RepID=A0ABR3JML2_9AGAR
MTVLNLSVPPTILLTGFFLFALQASNLFWRSRQTQRLPYPPGPRPVPFLGNIFNITKNATWLTYSRWANKYGDVLHMQVLSRHVVILNSAAAAVDLLEKRSRLYSDRPELTMLQLMGWGFNMTFMHYDDSRWRKYRRMLHQGFGPHGSIQFRPIQERQVHRLLCNLLASPQEFGSHLRTLAGSINLHAMYGQDVVEKNSYLVRLASHAVDTLSEEVFFSAQVLFALPWLKYVPEWFPGGGFKTLARKNRKVMETLQKDPIELVKKDMSKGIVNPCWTTELLEQMQTEPSSGLIEDDIKDVTATAFAGGIDTNESAIRTFLLAMVLYPDVQKRAQAEIALVVGSARLPNADDQPSLPYLSALCREVQRWHPPVPLGVSHAVSNDDVYRGYFIPKGAAVLTNIWAMSRDPKMYPDPDVFKPERFLTPDGELIEDSTFLSFGFGRRICPGRLMAESTIFLVVSNILSVFDIGKAKDERGVEVDVLEKYTTNGLMSQPIPFKCSIETRSAEAKALVLATRASH